MVNRIDADGEALLQQVIEHLRRQDVPEFPDPEIAVLKRTNSHASSVRPISTLRRIAMNRRFQLSAGAIAGSAAVLGFVVLWGGSTAQQASAMEKMAESVREAKSYRATYVEEAKMVQPDKSILRAKRSGKMYWQAPRSYRVDMEEGHNSTGGTVGENATQISFVDKPGINIDHSKKTYIRQPARQGHVPPLLRLEELGNFAGEANRTLGDKEIGGEKAQGFQVDAHKIDPDVPQGTMMDIWINQDSHLPVEISIDMKKMMALPERASGTLRIEGIEWNIQLDSALFDTTPPRGYTEAPIPDMRLSDSDRLKQVVDALAIYSELTGGHYPQVSTVYGDTTRNEVVKKLGIAWPPKSVDQMKEAKCIKAFRAARGFAEINILQRDNPDAAYYGKTVGPTDRKKVLLRWKLDDGRYQVIFGNLHGEIVTAERLRALEATQLPGKTAKER